MNFDRYGAACRCLLRIREKRENLVISDEAFIASHLSLYPSWELRPGAGDLGMIFALGEELGLCSGGAVVRGYDQVLASHRAGNEVLVCMEKQQLVAFDQPTTAQFALVVEMDETNLVLWEPDSDGLSATRNHERSYWDYTQAVGIELYAAKAAETVC